MKKNTALGKVVISAGAIVDAGHLVRRQNNIIYLSQTYLLALALFSLKDWRQNDLPYEE